MNIKKIVLNDFRGISNLELDLEGKSAVFFGVNGVGKSTILRAIDLLYANIISKLLRTQKKLANIDSDDIRLGRTKTTISADFLLNNIVFSYSRSMSKMNGRKHNQSQLNALVECFEENYIDSSYSDEQGNWIEVEDRKNMPVFVNYGVNRLVLDVPVLVSKKSNFTKLSAFDKAIESKIDFRSLFQWFRLQEDIENQTKVRENPDYEDKSLKAVVKAMLALLDDFDNVHIERKPLAMCVYKDGKSLKINQLSDGEKCVIALFGDLARRLTLANPELDDPLLGNGVVLIDELELHMHTSWQRKILRILKKTFPNIQFIITTHSPQILGEAGDDYNIYVLKQSEESIECEKTSSLIGWDSNVILEELMNTPHVNQNVKDKISTIYQLIFEKKYDAAETLIDELDRSTDGRAEGLAKARMLIARRRKF